MKIDVGKEIAALQRMTVKQLREKYAAVFGEAIASARHLKPGGAYYLWHADVTALPVRLACADAGLQVRQGLVWVKSVLVPGRQDYQWKHEPSLYG